MFNKLNKVYYLKVEYQLIVMILNLQEYLLDNFNWKSKSHNKIEYYMVIELQLNYYHKINGNLIQLKLHLQMMMIQIQLLIKI